MNASDFTDNSLTGIATVTNGRAIITKTLVNDLSTEAAESFTFNIKTSAIGLIVATSSIITVADTSATTVTPTTTSLNEGSPVTFNVTSDKLSTTLYWSLNPVSGSITTSDFVGLATTGSFNTDGTGVGSTTLTLANDVTTEGTESFQLQVRTVSISGSIIATSATVTVLDTSLSSYLYLFTSFTFTNGGATGAYGPSSFASDSSYTSQSWYSSYFSVSGGIQYWTAPDTGNYTIRAAGASSGTNSFCRGIIIESTIALIRGEQYKILIGQLGIGYLSNGIYYAYGGGGGTFMATATNTPIIVAGGGGGPTRASNTNSSNSDATSQTNGNYGSVSGGSGGNGGSAGQYGGGGGGFYSDGQEASSGAYYGGRGRAFVNGGYGGTEHIGAVGGFGGGGSGWGSTNEGAGGGGGYSGGGGGSSSGGQGGGGGSYSQTTISVIGLNRGNGYLTITKN